MRRTLTTGLLSGALALAVSAAAQDVGEEPQALAASDRRREPAEPVVVPLTPYREPERPGWIKRTVRSFLSDDSESGGGHGLHLGPLVPRIDIVSSGAGPAPMLHLWAPDIGGTRIDVHASASYSTFKYQYYDLQVGRVPHEGDSLPHMERGTSALFPLSDIEKTAMVPGFNIYASARYRDYPREDFYGLGPTSSPLDHTDYRLKDGLYEGIVRLRVGHLSLMGRAGLLQTSILPGTDPALPSTETSNSEGTAPGLPGSLDFVHLSGAVWLELRDEPRNPHRGLSLGAAFSRFDQRHGDAFQFNRISVEAREYIPLGSNRHVVALRQVTSLDEPDAGSSVPFYMQSTLGGGRYLRGYQSPRFRDNDLFALAAEYRFELHPKVELALIYETGKVFPTTDELDLRSLRYSWGAGIRLKSPKKVHLLLDVLRSAEGSRVDLKLGPSF
jgi:Omp85 superfamily domain